MRKLDSQLLKQHREKTYRLYKPDMVTNPSQALSFVNERGFIYFWPIKNFDLPSLWVAAAGNRPVPDAHDDPGHVTWGWKDQALGKKKWYYAKVLRRKATIISNNVAPFFYALSENYGSPEEDYLVAYREGRLTLAARQVYEALLDRGAMNTIDLRRAARLTSQSSDTEFNRALEVLQADFKIVPIGVAEAGAWRYAFIYDLVPRHLPEMVERARSIGEAEARNKLVSLYFKSVGAASTRDVQRLFGWSAEVTNRTIRVLLNKRQLVTACNPKKDGEWLALSTLTVRSKP